MFHRCFISLLMFGVVQAPAEAGAAHEGKPIIIAADGSGDFASIQAAVDSLATGSGPVTMHVKPGQYKQRLVIGKSAPSITLIGLGSDPSQTVLTFDLLATTVIPPATQSVGTSGSASTLIESKDFTAENVTFENSAGQAAQAVAIKVMGDRNTFRNCHFLGWQDTLCADGGRQYYVNCYIEGRVDFIFGGATAVFDRCTIHSKNGGYVTAARTKPHLPFGYVFLDCTLTGDDVPTYLGRPWQWDRGSNASVTFIRTKMGDHIRPEGWNPWDLKDKPNTDPASVTRYAEYGSTNLRGDKLDVSRRVGWSRQLSREDAEGIDVPAVLAGDDGWNPLSAE